MAVALKHVKEEPVPPSRRTEEELSEPFEAIIMACLAKAPEDRPASAEALYDQLRECPVKSPWHRARARRWWELHLPEWLARGPAGEASRPNE